jgi:hypothetical protein
LSTAPLENWERHLRQIAGPHADPKADLGLGELAPPFRAAVIEAPGTIPEYPIQRGEVGLWWARTDDRIDVDALIAAPTDGSLLPTNDYLAIEVWTDAELSALHALWWLARQRRREDWSHHVAAVRDWHIEHTQPDNATCRPWALHVFLLGGTPESLHYAETLLHISLTDGGAPTALGAWILLDAARAIDEARHSE